MFEHMISKVDDRAFDLVSNLLYHPELCLLWLVSGV